MPPDLPAAEPPLRVLVVDDCRDNADTLVLLLMQWGFDARCAYDAKSAISAAATFVPDVVMADMAMPGTTGLDLANRLRDLDPGLHSLVAITGYADEEHRELAAQAGFDFYFVKPPDLVELHAFLDAAARVVGHCRRIAVHADRTEILTREVRGLLDDIRDELRTVRAIV
jgi:CheY-like chemotaxis protein